MSIRIVRLGSPRVRGEGLRIGTVRHPPRGVPKREHASADWYDVWMPELSPTAELVKQAKSATSDREWAAFEKAFRAQMGKADASHLLDLLAALSHRTALSVGCYCEDETRSHRSVLRALLEKRGATFG